MLKPRYILAFGIVLCSSWQLLLQAQEVDTMPPNLGGGLRQLAAWHAAEAAQQPPQTRSAVVREHVSTTNPRIQMDEEGRIVADVYLSGAAPEAEVRESLLAAGAKILASQPAGLGIPARHGVLSVQLPVGAAAALAKLPGVRSISLVHRPWRRAGTGTSQGVVSLKSNKAIQRGINGAGITVGVISDSYNLVAPHAGLDVRNDDLPGTGNLKKRTTPVYVLQEGDPTDRYNIDEGRAMLQIVHDVAPGAGLAFAAVGESQATFADSIRRLRTDAGAHCDVVVDDISFPDEPFFSAGIVEQAVQAVVESDTLEGRKVTYFSAAGNEGDLGYEADFVTVPDAAVRQGNVASGNLKWDQVPISLSSGGFHDFDPSSATQVVQKLTISGYVAEFDFQWNDLFDPAEMTSDYNLLVFDAQGNYLPTYSSVDNNFNTGQAFEIIDLPPKADGSPVTYQLVISKTAAGAGTARHFRYLTYTDGLVDGPFLQQQVPTIFGHSGARSGNGVGAYKFNRLKEPESYSSFGPVTVYFDDDGQRLQLPEVRQQPVVSGPDGVFTTVLRPFFGTSAAAPHIAGVAALLLQAAGGPASLAPAQIRETLKNTAQPHDLDPYSATATATSGDVMVTLIGSGDDNNVSSSDPSFFTLHFEAPAGSLLKSVSIDLSRAGLVFDPNKANGFPFTVGAVDGGVSTNISAALVPGEFLTNKSRLVLRFASFPASGTLKFGLDRDKAILLRGGNSADFLARATLSASILAPNETTPKVIKGTFVNSVGAGFTPADGYGLVDADAALSALGY